MPTTLKPDQPQAREELSPQAVWQSVVQQAMRVTPLQWIAMLELHSVEGMVYRLTPKPGHREILKFITPARLEQLGQMLRQVSGRAAKAQLLAPATSRNGLASSEPEPGSSVSPARPKSQGHQSAYPVPGSEGGSSSAANQVGAADRRGALSLPLVQQVMQLFDVSVAGIYTESELTAQAAATQAGEQKDSTSRPSGTAPLPPGKTAIPPNAMPADMQEDELAGESDED